MAQGKQVIEVLNKAVQDYLFKEGFTNTLDVFLHELQSEKSKKDPNQQLNQLIKALDSGDRDQCLAIWNRSLTSQTKNSPEALKLEFYINLFLTIFPLHPLKRGKKAPNQKNFQEFQQQLDHFKEFLATKGQDLSQNEEFLYFYALPYINSPLEHPTFKILFTRQWLLELRERISKFFKAHSAQGEPSILHKIYKSHQLNRRKQGNQPKQDNHSVVDSRELQELNQRIQEQQYQLQTLAQKEEYARTTLIESQTKWTNFSKDILSLAKELYRSVEGLKRGHSVEEDHMSQILDKILKYDNFLNMNTEDLSANASFSNSQSDMRDFTPPAAQPEATQIKLDKGMTRGHSQLTSLNYAIVIRDLNQLQDELQLCSLIQALRWRLTRSQAFLRKETLKSYIKYNILCTTKPHDQLLDKLFNNTRRVKEHIVRFLNVVVSECAGRTYVLSKENVINSLVSILFEEPEDSLLRQNALGTLQKLSLRRQAQSEMIELDMIDWLGKLLKQNSDAISFYSLEYATALIMNLSLRRAGKDKIENSRIDIVQVLNNLLEHNNTQVRTYINGTLYSILTRQRLKERAFRLQLDKKLTYLIQNSDDHFKRQIQYIHDQLICEDEDDSQSDDNDDDVEDSEDDENDLDEFIAEDEDMDDVIRDVHVLTGEELLSQKYHYKAEDKQITKPFSRPVTPGNKNQSFANQSEEEEELPSSHSIHHPIEESDQDQQKQQNANPNGTGEFQYAFRSRDKIPRSPL